MLERIVGVAGGEHEQLGIEPLERLLELLLPPHPHHDLDRVAELDVFVAGGHDPRVAGRTGRSQDRQARAARIASTASSAGGPPRRRPRPAAPPRHRPRRRSARSVALGDGLAQTSGAGHASQHYRSWLRFSGALAPGDWSALAALPAVASAAAPRRSSERLARTSSPAGMAATASSRERATTGSRPSTTAPSTGSPAGRGGTSSRSMHATWFRATARS